MYVYVCTVCIYCNIIHFFTLTFNQFNAAMQNKCINFLKKKKKITDPKLLDSSVYNQQNGQATLYLWHDDIIH